MMKIAFAGLRHSHIFALAKMARENPDVEITGAWENDAQAAAAAREQFPEGFYESFDALLADQQVDTVAVGDYYGARGGLIIRALKAGKHVISDKPVCTDVAELDQIEALCREKGLKLGCMLDLRYDPAIRLAADMVSAGEIGEVRAAAFTGQHPLMWGQRPMWYFEEGKHGGTFNDIAVHGLDALEMITGMDYARTACARQWNAYAKEAPGFMDCAQFMGEMENGAGVIADVSYSAPSPAAYGLETYWRFTLWGEKGYMEFRYGGGYVDVAAEGDAQARRLAAPEAYDDCLKAFIREDATQSVIRSSRAALELQKFADANTVI